MARCRALPVRRERARVGRLVSWAGLARLEKDQGVVIIIACVDKRKVAKSQPVTDRLLLPSLRGSCSSGRPRLRLPARLADKPAYLTLDG